MKNQTDHFLISRWLKSAVLDTGVQKGADVNSDHYLVRTKIRAETQQVCQHEKSLSPGAQHGQAEG